MKKPTREKVGWGWRGMPGIEVAVHVVYLTALGALADAWFRLQGGKRLGS